MALDQHQLAKRICEKLLVTLTTDQVVEVNRLNATDEYQGACATHDFCDTNEVILDALESLGFEYDLGLNSLINEAHTIA